MIYPETRRTDDADDRFGIRVADPYRWLEDDVRGSEEVASWIHRQNEFTRSQLAELPARDHFRKHLEALFDHPRLTAPEKRGTRYFFTRNPGLDDHAVLVVREGDATSERVLVDPNLWSQSGTRALAEWAPSDDGRYVAFATHEGGADWRTIRVMDVESGSLLPDQISWARFTNIAWMRDGSGFFYSRFPEPPEGRAFEAPVADHAVYFHVLGTSQASDRLVHGSPTGPLMIESVAVTPDGRYATITSMPGAGGNALRIIDLDTAEWAPRPIVEAFDHNWSIVGNQGTRFLLATDAGAERGRIVSVDLAEAELHPREVVAERPEGTLSEASLFGDLLLATYLVNAKTEIRRYHADGTEDGAIDLPSIGTAGGFRSRPEEEEIFFVFTGLKAPTTVYRYDAVIRELSVWAAPEVAIDLERIVVEQRFYQSKDGTRVPMSVVRRSDVEQPTSTILYGYGGFGISLLPYYSPFVLAWVEAGGAYAIANLRGGGEYGKSWHDAGRRGNKQNVFDDFIAAAEYLSAEGIVREGALAIQGESNGGLLVGAVVNQRPELFAAALAGVGVMDMLRFDRFTNGQFWIGEYGDPANAADYRYLAAYSPYHTVRSGAAYPAILVSTADTDDRAVPAHSFKYAAALQAANPDGRPKLLRVDFGAGHGSGKPIGMSLDEMADQCAFAAYWTGLAVDTGA